MISLVIVNLRCGTPGQRDEPVDEAADAEQCGRYKQSRVDTEPREIQPNLLAEISPEHDGIDQTASLAFA